MSEPQVIVLCEDKSHWHFIRRFLQARGVKRFCLVSFQPGRGSKEQHVRERFATEVKAYRSKASHGDVALVVMVDADRYGVEKRKRQLATSLADAGQAPRGAKERIGVFVPNRNVQTWFAFLDRNKADEEVDWKPRYRDAAPTTYAERLADACRAPGALPNAPPSLRDACDEWGRLGIA